MSCPFFDRKRPVPRTLTNGQVQGNCSGVEIFSARICIGWVGWTRYAKRWWWWRPAVASRVRIRWWCEPPQESCCMPILSVIWQGAGSNRPSDLNLSCLDLMFEYAGVMAMARMRGSWPPIHCQLPPSLHTTTEYFYFLMLLYCHFAFLSRVSPVLGSNRQSNLVYSWRLS